MTNKMPVVGKRYRNKYDDKHESAKVVYMNERQVVLEYSNLAIAKSDFLNFHKKLTKFFLPLKLTRYNLVKSQ